MLAPQQQTQNGYTLLEALIATSMTVLVSAGLWQLVAATRTLAHTGFVATQPLCDTPQCNTTTNGVACSCGEDSYFIIR
jgi:hypothetical protein